jgi:serine/threonine protein kinase
VEGRKTGRKAIDDLERNSSSEGGTGGIMARATAMIKQCLSQMQVAAVEQNNVIVGQKAVPPANKEMYVKCQLGDVLIMVSSFISNCPVSSRAQLLEAVTRANFGLKIGQFIMDASDGEILFQTDLVMPRESTVADETLAHLLPPVIITNLVVHERYIPAFEAVRNCSKTAAEAISEVESSTNGRQTPQPAVISSSSAPLLLGPTAEYSSITLSAEKITKVWRKIGNSFPSGILYQAVFASNPVILREIMIEGKRKDKFLESVRREMCIPHPSLTFIHGIVFGRVIEHSGVLEVIEDRNKLLLVTQHCNHTSLLQWLDDVEAKRVEFSEVLALRLAEETALAMSVLHARDIVHTDLTMENVFVNEDNHAVVSSFGMLPHILENTPKDIEFLTTFCTAGRSVFHLDESCLQTGTFSKASDIFAFGILLYHVFVAKSPHTSVYSSEQDLNSAWNDGHYDRFAELFKQKVVEQGLHPKIGNLDHLSPPVKAVTRQLVESCLDRNPSNRPNFEQIAVMLNQAREYVESNSDKHIATTAMPKMTTIAAIHDDSFSNVPPKPPMGPSSSETTFALLPAVAAIKSGLGIEMNKKLDESLREAAEILGIEDEISALKTAKEKAIRICSEMGI